MPAVAERYLAAEQGSVVSPFVAQSPGDMGPTIEFDQDAEFLVAEVADRTVLGASVLALRRWKMVPALDVAKVGHFQSGLRALANIAE